MKLEYLTIIVNGVVNIKRGDSIKYFGELAEFDNAWDSVEKEGWHLDNAMVTHNGKTYTFIREIKQDD